VTLKPPNQWRKGMTWDKLLAELNANIKTPGMANIFWMPIQTRTEMLTTGFRSVLGVKVFGPDLGQIQKLAVQVEKELADLPNTRSAFAERTVGGYFLDFTVNREAAARYGLKVGDVNDIVATAQPAHSISAGLLHFVGGPVPISAGGQGAAQDRDPFNTADHFRAPLHEHEIIGENCNCVARRAVLVDWRSLASLHPRLQHE